MRKAITPNSLSFRFLFIGGWTAVKSSTMGSILAVFVTLVFSAVDDIWQNRLQTIELTVSGFISFVSSAAFLLLVAILLSAVPAFIGGVLLAWLMNRNNSIRLVSKQSKFNLGALIGASAGFVLTLLVLISGEFVKRMAHGGYGYNFLVSLPVYLFYFIEFVVIATIAGIWTDRQLRKYLENTRSNDTG
jgi:uncharacterized membrane protein